MTGKIAESIVRCRLWVVAICLVITAVLIPFSLQIGSRLEVGGSAIGDSEAEHVQDLLSDEFDAPFSLSLILVVSGIPPLDEDAGLDVLVDAVDVVLEMDHVEKIFSYLDTTDEIFKGPDGTFILVAIDPASLRMDEVVIRLRESTAPFATELRRRYPDADVVWTGAAAFDYDVRQTSTRDAASAERRVMPIALVLLFVIFGSLAAALCPVVIAGLGIACSLGAAVLITSFWPMTVLLQNIVSMIGLGLGIDYTLLMISRYREELLHHSSPEAAAIAALQTAGHTILLSGGAVAIGFGALLYVPATELRSIATGGLLVVAFSVALATLLLPALLTFLGHRVEAGRFSLPRRQLLTEAQWRNWGQRVVAQPVKVLLFFGLPLIALAWQARDISSDIPSEPWLPVQMDSTRGAIALHRYGQSGIVQAIRVVLEFPEGIASDSLAGWQTLIGLTDRLSTDERVARIVSIPKLLDLENAEQAQIAYLTDEVRAAYISGNQRYAAFEIIPSENASAGELMRYVQELRDFDPGEIGGPGGVKILVGGLPALNADYQHAIGGNVSRVIAFILLGSFVALLAGFRSLFAATKALLLNLLSVAAAMGLTVLVFQYGYGSEYLGVAKPLDGLFPAVPIIVFCVVFGLSMDYEVFLLARVVEAVEDGSSNDEAIVDGLAKSGRVITSAALLMLVVFIGFSLGEFLVVKILGFGLAAAILIDATIVRLAIGPALLKLGGRWNWWPGRYYKKDRPG
ncbi:MAG TPA: MMPL family transporter [Woeseiaceae bacterium]|nr:MMPL family transporter [Woeseiaceae bacterium]